MAKQNSTMDKILIGSKAIQNWFPHFNRKPSDLDYATRNYENITKEVEHFKIPILFDYDYNPSLILTLKASHLSWNINWWKHVNDVKFLLENGVQINEELYWKLFSYWEFIHGKRKNNFVSDNFFKDDIDRKYNHDDLHSIINYKGTPIHDKFVIENVPIKELYQKLSDEEKIMTAKEECYVIALERFLIPKELVGSSIGSYKKSLNKLYVSLIPDWMTIDLIKLLPNMWTPDMDYVHKFKQNKWKLKQKD